jgi:FkbM family methyltransferase
MSYLDQAISEFASAACPSSLPWRVVRTLSKRARKLRIKFGDPLVKFRWCGETICLPMSHDLPQFANCFPEYNVNLGRLASVMSRCLGRRLVAIDVGANVGDTAILLLRNGAEKVICIEGSSRYAELLRQNTRHLPQIVSTKCLAAFAGAPKNLCISEAMGTGCVVQSSSDAGVPVMTLDEVLACHQQNPIAVDLVKIDTDGYDGAIIRQHATFFAVAKPVIHFEYMFSSAGGVSSATNLPDEQVWETLSSTGYDRVVIYRNTGKAVAYRSIQDVGAMLRNEFALGNLGAYADIAAFPESARIIADQAAFELGLVFGADCISDR